MRTWTIPEAQGWSWQFVSGRVHSLSPEAGSPTNAAWVTDIDFETPAGIRRVRFGGVVPIIEFLKGEIEWLRVTERGSADRHWLEAGRFLVEIIRQDCVSSSFEAEEVTEILLD